MDGEWRLYRVAAATQAELAEGRVALTRRLRSGGMGSEIEGDGFWRLAVTARGEDGALAALDAADPVRVASGRAADPARAAFLLPGLGEQYPGMAGALLHGEPVFRQTIERAADVLDPLLGCSLCDLLSAPAPAARQPDSGGIDLRALLRRGEPGNGALERTSIGQPILFAVEYALARTWMAWGCRPAALLGYSLGEYVAAALAGVFTFEDALTLVAERARLIDALPEGAMLAVPLNLAAVAEHLPGDVAPVAINAPSLTVLGGPVASVEALARRLADAGHACQRLHTRHAFHTPMMEPARAALCRLVAQRSPRPPSLPYLSNVTGGWITEDEACDPAYWGRHLCEPVRFAENLAALLATRPDLLLEVGPGQSLCTAASLHPAVAESGVTLVASLPASYERRPAVDRLLAAAGRAWVAGVAIGPVPAFADGACEPASPPREEALRNDTVADGGTAGQVARLWADLLGRPSVGLDDNFFDLGGNSLLATRMLFRLFKQFRINLPLQALFDAPTPAGLAARLGGAPAAVPTPAAAAGGTGRRTTVLPNGLKIRHQSTAETEHFYADIFEHAGYLRHGVTLPPDACVFDVGANIGLFSVFVATRRPDARLYSFEPVPALFSILSENLARHCPRARAFNAGLSDRPGRASLIFYPDSSGMSSLSADRDEERAVLATILRNQARLGDRRAADLLEQEDAFLDARLRGQEVSCELRTLSEVIEAEEVARIDLLKVDVQKHELNVLLGIADGHWPRIGQVVAEVHDTDGRLARIVELLRSKGFRTAVEQDALYAGSPLVNVYAVRPGLPGEHTA